MGFIACCGTDVGISRKNNQDAVSVKRQTLDGKECYMAIVCDGVGGLSQGEYASGCMRERLEEWFLYEYPQIYGNEEADRIILERLKKVVELQNEILFKYGQERGIRCATTVSALLLMQSRYYIVHVGDSRVYLLNQKVQQLTEDQTLVAQEVKCGMLTPEEAIGDSRRNVILQSVGADRAVQVLLYNGNVQEDSSFLVCTDGFYHFAAREELLENFWKRRYIDTSELGQAVECQIGKIKRRGERDNISVVVLQQQGSMR